MEKGFRLTGRDHMDLSATFERLDTLTARGLLTTGQARRTGLAAALRQAGQEALSGQAVADRLGLSRAAVHKQVEQLRSLGFAITPVGGSGYRLVEPPDDVIVAESVIPLLLELAPLEPSWLAGLPYRYLPRCSSTNRLLRVAAGEAAPPPAGALAVTDEQTGGRGRLGRGWASRPGADLTFSVLLRPALPPARAHLLSLAAALAVAETLEGIPGLKDQVGIKWPNDVLLGERKVCGILLEGSMDPDRLHWAVAGIGLNVNSDPSDLSRGLDLEAQREWLGRPQPASLRQVLGKAVPRAPLLARLLANLTERWSLVDPEALLAGVRRRDLLRGLPVEVVSGPPDDEPVAAGEAAGIGAEGQLLVQTPDGRQVQVFAGDVTIRSFGRPR